MEGDSVREKALREAGAALSDRGFEPADDGWWSGTLAVEGMTIPVRVSLPEDFPDCLPEVRVDRKSLPRRIPHIEGNGKLCLIPSTGVLIDAARAGDLVRESLSRSQALLTAGLSGANEPDLTSEFLAYWDPEADGKPILSICRPTGATRPISLLRFRASTDLTLAADDAESGRTWLERQSIQCLEVTKGWLHFLAIPFPPPDFGEELLTKDFMRLVVEHSSETDRSAFKAWREATRLPWTVVCAMPVPGQAGLAVFAVTFRQALGDNRKQALKGFRPASVPVQREFQYTLNQPVARKRVQRMGSDYLLPRAGGSLGFVTRTVVVVGCGAVGSHLVEKLARLGIGTLRLIDNEVLLPENVYRHVLGLEYIRTNKAKAMRTALGKRFPHLAVEHREEPILKVMRGEPSFVTGADLVCVALGDETLELRLDQLLRFRVPRIHAWVEPLSIGGHILATGCQEGGGCFRCLFRSDDMHGLVNRSAFADPGQTFGRSLAGCAGLFTPFTGLDADRTAAEAARLVAAILSGAQRRNVLKSWFGDPAAFLNARFRLSPRAVLFQPGAWKIEEDFRCRSCACQQWTT